MNTTSIKNKKPRYYPFYKLDMNSREYENINPERNNDFKRYDTRQRVYVNELEFDLDEILEGILKVNIYGTKKDVDAAVEFEKNMAYTLMCG